MKWFYLYVSYVYNACTVNHLYCAVIELPCAPASCEWPAPISDQFLVIYNTHQKSWNTGVRFRFCGVDLGITAISVLQNTCGSTLGRRGAYLSKKKSAMIECKKQCLFQRFVMSIVASIRSLRSMDRSFQARSFHLILHPVIPLRDLQLMKLVSTVK